MGVRFTRLEAGALPERIRRLGRTPQVVEALAETAMGNGEIRFEAGSLAIVLLGLTRLAPVLSGTPAPALPYSVDGTPGGLVAARRSFGYTILKKAKKR